MEIWNFFAKKSQGIQTKAVPKNVAMSDTKTRGTISKAHLPQFLVKPPFGHPRNKDIGMIRRLANTPQAAMGRKAVIDVISEVPWDIVPKEGFSEDNAVTKSHVMEVKQMFINPNSTKETFNDIQKQVVTDMIDLNAGVIVKEFNSLGQFTEWRAADGGSFLMNPNRFGKFTEREDLILTKNLFVKEEETDKFGGVTYVPDENLFGLSGLTVFQAAEKAAYFQFPWRSGGKPIPFGIREIVWIQENTVTYDIYGISVFEYLLQVLQTLVYLIQYELDYFEDNNIPKGIINLGGAEEADVDDFADRWNEMQMSVNQTGQLKRATHRAPITNFDDVKFEKIQFSPQELDFISATKLFQKMVWGMLGVMPSDVGFTDDSNRSTEISQDKKFLRRAILPRLKILEEKYNQEIISEFEYDDVEFKFKLFNIDEETSKANLFNIQLAGKPWLTVNEIRRMEGLEEVEGGDELGSSQQDQFVQEFNEDTNDTEKDTDKNEKDKMDEDKKKQDTEKKAFTSDTAATLGEFELIGTIRKILKQKKDDLIEMLRKELGKTRMKLTETKAVDDLTEFAKDLFDLEETKGLIDQATENIFTDNFQKMEVKLQQNLTMNREQIRFLSNTTFDNIKDLAMETKNDLRGILQRGIINGLGVGKLTEQIEDVFSKGVNRAEMIARTETNRIENQGQLQAMKASGRVATKTWLSTVDKKTSGICKRLNGQTVPLEGKFKDSVTGEEFDAPPALPNCRSTVLFNLEDDEEIQV